MPLANSALGFKVHLPLASDSRSKSFPSVWVTPPTATVRLFAIPAAHVPLMVGKAESDFDISTVGAVSSGAGGGVGGGGASTTMASFCVILVTLPATSVSVRFKSYLPGARVSVGTKVNAPLPSAISSLSLPIAYDLLFKSMASVLPGVSSHFPDMA